MCGDPLVVWPDPARDGLSLTFGSVADIRPGIGRPNLGVVSRVPGPVARLWVSIVGHVDLLEL
jgi:hypothetical protein